MNDAAEQCNTAALGAQRHQPKPWSECGLEEKLDRLRDVARNDMRNRNNITRNLSQRVENLEHHTHDQLGRVTIPVHTGRGGYMVGEGSSFDPLA